MKSKVSIVILVLFVVINSLFPVAPSNRLSASSVTIPPADVEVEGIYGDSDPFDMNYMYMDYTPNPIERSVLKFSGISGNVQSAKFVFEADGSTFNQLTNMKIALAPDTWPATFPDPVQPGASITRNISDGYIFDEQMPSTRPGVFKYKIDISSLMTPANIGADGVVSFIFSSTTPTISIYFDSMHLEVVYAASNTAPVLYSIGNKSVNEGNQLSFTAAATDAEGDSLAYSLVDPPSGASINAMTGAFTWTPTEAQGPGSYTFKVRVSDGALSDEEAITVTVYEVNVAPVLGAIGNKTVDVETQLTFTAIATDADIPENTLTYSLVDAPSGASIDATSGAFTWTPTEAQGPESYTFKVRVSDGVLSDEETITVTVNKLNAATPSINTQPASQIVDVNGTATLSVNATVSDSGLLSYQWYSNSTNSNSGGTLITGATGSTYTAPTDVIGEKHYYVIVTNYNASASGVKTAFTASDAVKVTVNTPLSFTVSETGTLTFDALIEGYSTAQVNGIKESVTLTKVGNGAITGLAVSFSGGASSSFTTGTVSPDSLGAGVNSAVLQVFPKVGLAKGTHTETVTITADGGLSESFQVSFTVTPSTFTVSETGTLTFDALIEGYSTAQVNGIKESVTLTKVGNGAITGLAVSFSGGASSSFTTGTVSPDSLGAGVNSAVLQVFPKVGLAKGTHTETVTITADGGLSESFQVSFTVTPSTFTVSETGTLTFDALIEGYSTAQVNGIKESVTLTKVGNGAITGLAVSFSGGASSSFTTGTVLPDSLGAGVNSAVLQVFPKVGLAKGTHTETVTITADGGLSESFQVSFTVTPSTFTVSETGTVTFDSLIQGYSVIDLNGIKESVTLTKVGNGAITGLAVSFSGGASSSFTTGTVLPDSLGAGVNSTVLQVFPKSGLAPGTHTETVTITADGGISHSFQVSFTVILLVDAAIPVINAQPVSETVDKGTAVTLSVGAAVSDSGTLSYQWFSNATNSNIGGTPIVGANSTTFDVPTDVAGTYYYYVGVINTNNSVNGAKIVSANSIVAEVTLLEHAVTPAITAQPTDETVNVGGSASLTVAATTSDGGTLSYQWYASTTDSNSGGTLIAGADSATYSIPTSISGTYYYYAVVTNTNNSVNGNKTASVSSAAVEVTVLEHAVTPAITAQPTDETVNVGGSASLTVAATTSDGGTLSYQWYASTTDSNSGGTLIAGADSATYSIPTSVAGAYYYYAVVTNTNNSVNGNKTASISSAAVEVTVLEHAVTPAITAQPTDETVNVGGSASLTVAATTSDGGTLSYQWYASTTDSNSGGTLIAGADSATYSIPTSVAGAYYYYAVVTNTNNSVNGNKTASVSSAAVEVTVLEHAVTPAITAQPTDETVNVGGSASLTVAATTSDGGTLSYQWYASTTDSNSGGTLIAGADSATYSIPTSISGTYYYYAVVTNTNNSVNGNKTASVSSAAVEVTVLEHAVTPAITAQPTDETVNVGGSASLTVAATTSDGGTLSYQWYASTTDSNSGGTLIAGADSATYSIPTSVAGTYYYYAVVTNTNNSVNGNKTASVSSAAVEVTVLEHAVTPAITAQPTDETVNVGGSASLTVAATTSDGGTLSYQWYASTTDSNSGGTLIAGADSATYSIPTSVSGTYYYYAVVTNTNNSVNGNKTASVSSAAVEVTVLEHAVTPAITAQPTDETVNVGGSASLTVAATTSDSGTLSYQWYASTTDSNSGGTLIAGADSATYSIPTSVSGTYYYYAVVTNTNNSVNGNKTASVSSAAVEVTVLEHAVTPAITAQPTDETVNVGGSASLTVAATTSDGGTLSYQWYASTTDSNSGGTLIAGADSATYSIPTSVAGTYYYYAVVTNTNNSVNGNKTASVSSAAVEVTVLEHAVTPAITAQPTDETVNVGGSASLTVAATTSDGGTLSYQWYASTTDSNSGGTLIAGADSATYSIPTSVSGTYYYYAVVTNTNNSVNGNKTASVSSAAAEVTLVHTYGIEAISDQTATNLTQGYAESETQHITITNSGTGVLTNIAVAISGDDAEHFVITQPASSLNAGEATSFTIAAKEGLVAETYSISVTITAQHMSSESFTFTQVVVLPEPPVKPQQVTATRGNGQISIAWDAAAGATYYNLYLVTGEEQYTLIDTISTLAYTYDNLVNGTEYSFVVRAGNPGGLSDYSAPVQAVPATVPGTPTTVKAYAGDRQARVTFTVPDSNGGSEITEYEVTASPGNIVAKGSTNNIVVKGLSNGVAYTFTVKAINSVGESEASLPSTTVTPRAISVDDSLPDNNVEIIVNGKVESAGIVKKSTVNGKLVTTIVIDEDKMLERLAAVGEKSVITIPFVADSDIVAGEISGRLMNALVGSNATIVIHTAHASYTLPASELDIAALSTQLGANGNSQEVTWRIEIAEPSAEVVRDAEAAIAENGLTAVAAPLEFKVYATYGNTTVEVTKFKSYVEHTITIPEGVDSSKITTGIVIEEDGSIRHVPTNIQQVDGRYYAHINSFTGGAFSLIWNPVQFTDMDNHWARDAVNNMGSRMVINGVGNGLFNPDQDITRAEFAAIIVRGLGLSLSQTESIYEDVARSAWYRGAVQTAYESGLINGFTDGTFRPNDKITREQAMLILSKAMVLTGLKVSTTDQSAIDTIDSFIDADAVSSWALHGVADSVSAGIVSGRNNNQLAPQANITRAEVAMIIQRLLQLSKLINE